MQSVYHSLLRQQDPKPLGVVPLAGNEVVKYPREENDPGKYKFEIRGEFLQK